MSKKSDQVKGRVKEIAGTGKTDRRAGEIKERLDHAKDRVEELVDQARDMAEKMIDKLKGK